MNASNYPCSDWQATHNFMPGPQPPTLRVTGKCTFLTDGYAVRLERAEPQGINPAILLLNRIVSPLPVWRLKWCRKLQLYGQFENGVYDALKAM